jgi:hypothetical protein
MQGEPFQHHHRTAILLKSLNAFRHVESLFESRQMQPFDPKYTIVYYIVLYAMHTCFLPRVLSCRTSWCVSMRELSKSRLLQRVIAMIQAGRPPKGPREKWQMLSDTS